MQVLEAINSTAPERYQFREFQLDRHERQLTADGKAVHLQPRCFDVLLCLLQQPGKLVEKQAIIRGSTELWRARILRDQHIDGLRALVYFQSGLFEAAIKYALKNAIDYVNYDGHDPYLLAFAYQQVDDIESMNPLLGILRKNQKSYWAQGINNPEEDYLMAIVHILENDSAGAMTWLTRAVTAGYRPFPKLHDNVLFSSLYERLDYIELKNQLQNERDEELAKVQPYLAGYRKIISAVNLTN